MNVAANEMEKAYADLKCAEKEMEDCRERLKVTVAKYYVAITGEEL